MVGSVLNKVYTQYAAEIAPLSDALMSGKLFSACPRFRHAPQHRKTASLDKAALDDWANAFKRLR